MKISVLVFLALTLAGCGSPHTTASTTPVDMRGVDAQKFAYDLAECQDKARNGGFIQLGAPVSNCLENRGYHVNQKIN